MTETGVRGEAARDVPAQAIEVTDPVEPARKPERVAFISLHASPTASLGRRANGGLNVYVREVCAALAAGGVASDVFTRRSSPGDPASERVGPLVRVVYLPAGPPAAGKHELFDHVESFAEEVAAWVARHGLGYDALYSHYWLSGAAACTLRGRLRTPWLHTAHTLALTKNASLAPGAAPEPELRELLEGEISRSADLLVVSTETEAEALTRAYGVRRDQVEVVAPGVDLERFSPGDKAAARRRLGYPPESPLLLFVGRLERLKGVEVILRAMALCDELPGLRLAVVGEDSHDAEESEEERLRALAARLGVAGRVDFRGSVPQSELPDHYRAADACVMPSYSESFGLVGLEAQACACAVIAADLAGLASVVRDGVTGFLVEGHEPAEWAGRIVRLLGDPVGAEQMGRRAHLLAQRFTWNRTASRLSAAITRLAGPQLRVQAALEGTPVLDDGPNSKLTRRY